MSFLIMKKRKRNASRESEESTMKYETMIHGILNGIGGVENVESVYHCATRLRFQLKDEGKANDEAVKETEGVLSL